MFCMKYIFIYTPDISTLRIFCFHLHQASKGMEGTLASPTGHLYISQYYPETPVLIRLKSQHENNFHSPQTSFWHSMTTLLHSKLAKSAERIQYTHTPLIIPHCSNAARLAGEARATPACYRWLVARRCCYYFVRN